MNQFFVKINENDYWMWDAGSPSDEELAIIKEQGYIQVSEELFDKLFLLYEDVLNKQITISEILELIEQEYKNPPTT